MAKGPSKWGKFAKSDEEEEEERKKLRKSFKKREKWVAEGKLESTYDTDFDSSMHWRAMELRKRVETRKMEEKKKMMEDEEKYLAELAQKKEKEEFRRKKAISDANAAMKNSITKTGHALEMMFRRSDQTFSTEMSLRNVRGAAFGLSKKAYSKSREVERLMGRLHDLSSITTHKDGMQLFFIGKTF